MVFFRKNKRQFGFCHHRKVFVAMFLFAFLATTIVSLISRANAAEVPVPSVEFYSENTDYQNGEEGAWKITKSASWTGQSSARITFDVKTIAKQAERNKLDLVLVLDNSGSMEGAKMARLQTDASNLINVVLEDTSNQIAIVSFDSIARIHTSFTNDKNLIVMPGQIHGSGSFCSTITPSIMEFYDYLGLEWPTRVRSAIFYSKQQMLLKIMKISS